MKYGKILANDARIGRIIRSIEPGKTIAIAMADKLITIAAERYKDRNDGFSSFDYLKCDDELSEFDEANLPEIKNSTGKGLRNE